MNKGKQATLETHKFNPIPIPGGGKNGIPKNVRITIWDTLGAVSKEAAIKTFYKKATVAIIVFSVDQYTSF